MEDQYTEISLTAHKFPATDQTFLRRYSRMLDKIYDRLLESKQTNTPLEEGSYIYEQMTEAFGAAAVNEAFMDKDPDEQVNDRPMWLDVLLAAMPAIAAALDQAGQSLLADLISRQFWDVVILVCYKVAAKRPELPRYR